MFTTYWTKNGMCGGMVGARGPGTVYDEDATLMVRALGGERYQLIDGGTRLLLRRRGSVEEFGVGCTIAGGGMAY